MQKHLLRSLIILLSFSVIFKSENKKGVSPEYQLKKSITFTVYPDKNYSAVAYKDALAQPRIIIHKLKSGEKILLWDKTYDFKYLHDYSLLPDRMFETVVINNLGRKEKLEVTYVLTYYTGGSVLRMYNDTVFNSGGTTDKLDINI